MQAQRLGDRADVQLPLLGAASSGRRAIPISRAGRTPGRTAAARRGGRRAATRIRGQGADRRSRRRPGAPDRRAPLALDPSRDRAWRRGDRGPRRRRPGLARGDHARPARAGAPRGRRPTAACARAPRSSNARSGSSASAYASATASMGSPHATSPVESRPNRPRAPGAPARRSSAPGRPTAESGIEPVHEVEHALQRDRALRVDEQPARRGRRHGRRRRGRPGERYP